MSFINQQELTALVNANLSDIKTVVTQKIKSTIAKEISGLFDPVREYGPRGVTISESPGQALVKELVNEASAKLLTSEYLQKKIDDRFETILNEEMENAMRKKAKHMANKLVFSSRDESNAADKASKEVTRSPEHEGARMGAVSNQDRFDANHKRNY